MKNLYLFLKLSRPLFLIGAALLYALGVGVAKYLGTPIDWGIYLLGQLWGTTLQLAVHYLNEYYDAAADAENPNRTLFSGGSGVLGGEGLPRQTALWAGVTSLAICASLTVLIFQRIGFSASLMVLMLLIFSGAVLYVLPPVRLAGSGYGEITTAVLVANLVPVFAFVLQTQELHRLLTLSTLPLTFLHLSMMLAFELPDYGTDLKHDKKTMMVRLGWEAGMRIHNLSILSAYLLLAAALFVGLPLRLGWSGFLTLPLGLFLIWYMNRIGDGMKPNWRLLTFTAIALYGLTAYLITFTYWIS